MPASDGAGTGPKRTQFAASDGKYRLARSWSHPNGPVPFNPAGGSKVTVAKLPAPRSTVPREPPKPRRGRSRPRRGRSDRPPPTAPFASPRSSS